MYSIILKFICLFARLFGYDINIVNNISIKQVIDNDCIELHFGNLSGNPFEIIYLYSPYIGSIPCYGTFRSDIIGYEKKIEIFYDDNIYHSAKSSIDCFGFVFSTGNNSRGNLIWLSPLKFCVFANYYLVNFAIRACNNLNP